MKISGKDEKQTQNHAELAARILAEFLSGDRDVQILGPIEAAIQRISSRFRWQILVKGPSARSINQAVSAMAADPRISRVKGVSIGIDVDPYSLM